MFKSQLSLRTHFVLSVCVWKQSVTKLRRNLLLLYVDHLNRQSKSKLDFLGYWIWQVDFLNRVCKLHILPFFFLGKFINYWVPQFFRIQFFQTCSFRPTFWNCFACCYRCGNVSFSPHRQHLGLSNFPQACKSQFVTTPPVSVL